MTRVTAVEAKAIQVCARDHEALSQSALQVAAGLRGFGRKGTASPVPDREMAVETLTQLARAHAQAAALLDGHAVELERAAQRLFVLEELLGGMPPEVSANAERTRLRGQIEATYRTVDAAADACAAGLLALAPPEDMSVAVGAALRCALDDAEFRIRHWSNRRVVMCHETVSIRATQRSVAQVDASPGPVIVYDSNPDALERRITALVTAVPMVSVIGTVSSNAVMVLATYATPETSVFVDLCTADRVTIDRPGERLIERLTQNPATAHVRPVAWSAHVGPEVVSGARQAGSRGFVTATLRREREAADLKAAIAGDERWPPSPPDEGDWERWFRGNYGAEWEAWMEPMLVRLASSGERRSIATELVAAGAARSANHAAARLRRVARLVAGEHANDPPAVAERAAITLGHLARCRPLAERPMRPASLERAADMLRSSPSIALAAGLSELAVEDVLALEELIRHQRAGQASSAGAPPADRVRAERRWAAGRIAAARGAGRDEVDAVIDGVLARVDRALIALEDAMEDALEHPRPRAAIALMAAGAGRRVLPAGVAVGGITRTWRGMRPEQLALDESIPEADAQAFVEAVDQLLARSVSVA